jgi:DMSO/TMAO reductase YedYZ molybdopterin-dependent catalytic subunit
MIDASVKDVPTSRVAADVLIGYAMNRRALSAEHGFPARLVVPGVYGTNSVKGLTQMTLAAQRAPGPFTARWDNDPVREGASHDTWATTPVWSIAPESLIVSPMASETIEVAAEQDIGGWAWADGGSCPCSLRLIQQPDKSGTMPSLQHVYEGVLPWSLISLSTSSR